MHLYGLDDLIHNKSLLVAPVIAAVVGGTSRMLAVVGEQTPTGIALWILASGACGALFAGLAKLVSSWFSAKHNQRILIDSETATLIERLHGDYKSQIREAQFEKNRQKRIAALKTRQTHNVLNAYGALAMYTNEVVRELERAGVKPEGFRVSSYTELVGEEDEKIERILAERPPDEA